jgi:predicted nucleic acid-binding Zn ribbon protein
LRAGLDALLGHLGGPSAGAVRGLFDDWDELVGDRIAAHARPRSLRDGALTVDVDDPAWASQLGYLEHDLLERLAERLGEGVVGSIRYRVRVPRRT